MFWLMLIASIVVAVKSDSTPDRILNAKSIEIFEHQYIASIYSREPKKLMQLICGGALLARRSVLSAASCFNGIKSKKLRVRLGSPVSHAFLKYPLGKLHKVSRILEHGGSKEGPSRPDVALVVLATPAEYSNLVAPIPVAFYNVPVGDLVLLLGFGHVNNTNEKIPVQSNLHQSSARVLAVHHCYALRPHMATPADATRLVCGGTAEESVGATDGAGAANGVGVANGAGGSKGLPGGGPCTGDVGGPVVHNGHLVAVMTEDQRTFCQAIDQTPALFTRAISYLPWIAHSLVD